ncbi:MAG: hypothetical protein K8S94_10785 [Planctomycetia bacterium]|nr:hypothetical protein [Planctomycetia bacterium]
MSFRPARSFRIVAFLVLVMTGVSAHAEIVFGNLGTSGTGALSATNTDYGGGALSDPVFSLAQGFTTSSGTQNLLVGSVTLGLFSNDTPSARTVSIYPNNAGVPGGSPLFTSSAVNVTTTGKYEFSFGSGAQLAASTSYWIVPEGPASWYYNSAEDQPTAQNSSGWAYLGTMRITNTSTGAWIPSIGPYSVSVVAVPEPPAIVMAGIGIASAIWSVQRRRKPAS